MLRALLGLEVPGISILDPVHSQNTIVVHTVPSLRVHLIHLCVLLVENTITLTVIEASRLQPLTMATSSSLKRKITVRVRKPTHRQKRKPMLPNLPTLSPVSQPSPPLPLKPMAQPAQLSPPSDLCMSFSVRS